MTDFALGVREDAIRAMQEDKFLDSLFGDDPEPMDDQVCEMLDTENMYVIKDAVIDYAIEDELSATLKSMLTAYQFSFYGNSKADRKQHADDFVIFAKSFANVCIEALGQSLEAV